jgi:RNA polymerase sigma factor (sigma-70 family)
MQHLVEEFSPLAQARRSDRVGFSRSVRNLRPAEEALLKSILNGKYEYVDQERFHGDDDEAMRAIFIDAEKVPKPDTSWYHPLMDTATAVDHNAMARNQGSVLLTAAQERVIFSQFNYCRYRVCRVKDQLIDQPHPDPDLARELLDWHERADAYRSQIADTNLALVLAMAKRTRMNPTDFPDLISEGNMALLRAVDKFDVGRGFKFSTYACRAILKAFSRQGIKFSKYRGMFPTDFDPKLERSNYVAEKNAAHEDDCVDEVKRIVHLNTADLSDVEQKVVAARFNVSPDREDPEAKPLTLEQVGKQIGVTKERVRQIQNKALDKIRDTLETQYLN